MGHMVGKDVYRRLGDKLDGLTVRVPWSPALRGVLEELYSPEDAELLVAMPWGLSSLSRLARVTGWDAAELAPRLEDLAARGLVLDLRSGKRSWYAPSPLVIGVFEFTMMRAGAPADQARWARLFHDYLEAGPFYAANFGHGERVSVLRSVPHEGTVVEGDHVEVLDHEKATAIVEAHDRFAVGLCSCRHEKRHAGATACATPLETCTSFGMAADYLVRNRLGRPISKGEMLERLARSRELGLVLNADNVRRRTSFMCHCCGCCCNVLLGVSRHGYPNTVVTSSFIAASDRERCLGCGKCSKRCPVGALPRVPDPDPRFRKHGRPSVDEARCLGCGVCATTCNPKAMRLHPRAQRVLHPEDTFERVLLQCLERGTLQNQLLDDPASKTQAFLRPVVGAFLRLPPVKQALMSDALRSRFLGALRRAAGKKAPPGVMEA